MPNAGTVPSEGSETRLPGALLGPHSHALLATRPEITSGIIGAARPRVEMLTQLRPAIRTRQSERVRRLLLTSAGVSNASIHEALLELLGRPIEDCTALCIPTAMYGHPHAGPGENVWEFVAGRSKQPMIELGWKSVGLLELTALPSIDEKQWVPLVRKADVLLVSGGDALYLCHWMRACGLTGLLSQLDDTVWIGMSAGSMVMSPRIGKEFVGWKPPAGDDRALGLVGFSIFPHLDHELLPDNTLASAKRWAADLDCPAYAIDDETAIRVIDGAVDVVSEGQWHRFDA